jgi:hypothetical protein
LDRGRCRLGIPEVDELRNLKIMGADGVKTTGRQHGGARQRECVDGPAESKTPGMHRNFTRENRETLLVIRRKRTDRWEKAMSYKTHMNDDRESSGGIVPTKRSNKDQGGSKGNRGGKAAGRGERNPADTRTGHRAE